MVGPPDHGNSACITWCVNTHPATVTSMTSRREPRQSTAFRRSQRYKRAAASLGVNVRALRKARGLTLERTAEATHLDFRHIQQVEAGQLNVTLATVLRLADGLGVEPADLLMDINFKYGAPTLVPVRVTGAGVPKGAAGKRSAALPNPAPAPTTAAVVQRMVGRAVAAFRRASGMTQAELAARASVAVQYVQRVEAGKQNLTIATCVKFANALGVEPVRLFAPVERP